MDAFEVGLVDDRRFAKERGHVARADFVHAGRGLDRSDREIEHRFAFAVRRRMMMELEKTLSSGKVGALILEDYAKGLFSKNFMQSIVDYAAEKGIMTTLDPHPNNAFNVKVAHSYWFYRKLAQKYKVTYLVGVDDVLKGHPDIVEAWRESLTDLQQKETNAYRRRILRRKDVKESANVDRGQIR